MGTDSAEAILRAARRTRRDAMRHIAAGETAEAEVLFEAIRQAEDDLKWASAYMRREFRPLSVGGHGEEMDRLQDLVDRWHLRLDPPEEEEDEATIEDEQWDAFVEEHPELTAPSTFTDDEIIAALRAAIEILEQPWLQGAVHSGDVLALLMPGERAPRLVVRTGKHLARLARAGRVVRLRPKWSGRGSSIWSLPGLEINEWWLKQYEVDDA